MDTYNNDVCPICLQKYIQGEYIIKMSCCCNTVLHRRCYMDYRNFIESPMRKNCIMCRKLISDEISKNLNIEEFRFKTNIHITNNITVNINNTNESLIDSLIDYLKLDQCFNFNIDRSQFNENRSCLLRNIN